MAQQRVDLWFSKSAQRQHGVKIRLAIASKNKGKSGGARVLSFVKVTQTTVLLFSIYSKSEIDNLTNKEIKDLIKDYL